MKEKVFYAVPAFIGRVETSEVVHFWCDPEPPMLPKTPDQAKLIKLDFSKTPEAVGLSLATLDDNYASGGLNGLLPPYPDNSFAGGVYCAGDLLRDCRLYGEWDPDKPSAGSGCASDKDYQYQSLIIDPEDGSALQRYHGFRVKVIQKASSPVGLMLLDVYEASATDKQWQVWANVEDSDTCHPLAGGYTKIGSGASVNDEDAIFFTKKFITGYSLRIPKLPPGMGGMSWPTG